MEEYIELRCEKYETNCTNKNLPPQMLGTLSLGYSFASKFDHRTMAKQANS